MQLGHNNAWLHLLVSLPTIFLILFYSRAGKPAEPVYDSEGNELISGEEYYIIPFNYSQPSGGLILAHHNTSWPLFIVHDTSQPSNGNPVTIIPVTNNRAATMQAAVSISSNVHMQFVSCAVCLGSMIWKIGDREGANGRQHIVVGVKEDYGYSNNQFKIEKHKTGGYELFFCPKVCKLCTSVCQNVGVLIEGGKRWLGLEGSSLTVAFKKNDRLNYV